MKPLDRYEWIENWMVKNRERYVDVLNKYFVECYADATGAKEFIQFYGAPKCPQLGRDLGQMYRMGILKRHSTGLAPGDSYMGFPKWVWSYQLVVANTTRTENDNH